MAKSSCSTCGKGFRSVSIDSTGTLAICTAGHYNFDPGSRSDNGSITTGSVKVKGQSAIGDGAVAISGIKGRKGKR
ncbi:hypothetical protein [Micromonospora sp. NPDC005324]|uniref:hypothetical protein n=1 Tax=Micromonospora sp. NPDC005324 TaxID=3157033 RepID=UPI0033A506F7